ncbi:GPCR kinase [Tanacetum coccineum]
MACSLPHTDFEIEVLVQKLIDEDKGRQNAILDLALQFENYIAQAKDDLKMLNEMDIQYFLKKEKLEQVVAIVKSCSPNVLGDLNVTMKDLSGTIPGTVHHKVIGEGGNGKDITVGAAMILANVSVFTPKPSEHYLNITKRNVVKIFRKDTVTLV